MYFSQNIKLLRKRRGKTQDDLAFTLGLKRPTLSGYENGVAEPGLEILLKFSAYFNIALDTLLKIDLSALTESQLYQLEHGQDVYITGKELRILATTVSKENEDNIELVPEKAKAGYVNGFSDPEFISALQVYQMPFLSPNKKYRTFQLRGDSMLPIPDGSWVTGEFVQDWNDILNGEACIILTLNDGIVFKIVENKISDTGILTLYSLNPLYEPFGVEVKEIREVWKFVHFISSEIPDPVMSHDDLVKTVTELRHDVGRIKEQMKE